MEELLVNGAGREGFFAVLFIALFVYQLKENRRTMDKAEEREEKLTSFLEEMKDEFSRLGRQYERLADDVDEIRRKIDRI